MQKYRKALPLAGMLACICTLRIGYAQTSPDGAISQVVVTATRDPQELTQVPASVSVLSGQRISDTAIPANDAFSGFIQWGRIPLENVERIEVVRGACG